MTAGLTAAGLEIKTLEEIRDETAAAARGAISPNLNTGSRSPNGEIIGAASSQTRQVWEALQAVYTSRDPDQASGDALTALSAQTGTIRRAASYSTDLLDLDLDAGSYAAGSLIVHVDGDPTARFENAATVTSPGGVVAGVPMRAQATGPVRANAGTLTQIATSVAGFNAVDDDPEDASLGREVEKDSELRLRREAELARRGSSTVDAIRVDIENVDDVDSALVVENVEDTTVDGLLPHSVAAYVTGGTDAEVAAALWNSKGAGINTNGTTSVAHVDSQGVSHTVKFYRTSQTDIYVAITLTALTGKYAGDTKVKETIVDWGDANQKNGVDVIYKRVVALVLGCAGVVDATITIGTAPSPVGTTNIVIAPTAFADFDTSRISVSSSLISAPP